MNVGVLQLRDVHFKQVEMTDWELVRFLRDNKWDGEWTKHGNSNTFTRHDSYALAVVFYDNSACTRDVWVRREVYGKG